MDNLQTGIFDRVYYDLGLNAAEALGELGNCEAKKLHRGPVYLLMTGEVGRRDATLTVARYPAQPDDVWSTSSRNGNALDVIGALNMQGPLVGGFFWGQANADWVNAGNQNAWESTVEVTVVQDAEGTACPVARTVTVYLPRTATSDPNVRQGDILQFMICRTGKAYCTSDVLDGKIGEIREFVSVTAGEITAFSASGGYRGWHVMDGNHGSTNASGDSSMLYGRTGSSPFATVGIAVSAAFTASIVGSGGNITLTIATNTTGITVAQHSATACAVTDPGHYHEYGANNQGTSTPGGDDVSVSTPMTTETTGITVDTPILTHNVSDGGHGHSGSTVSADTIAGNLGITSAGTNRPGGIVILRVQRLD